MPAANDIRKGQVIKFNGEPHLVMETQHRTPGNLRAFVQASLRSLRTGKTSDVRFSSTEKIDVIPMMTRKMEFSYKDGEDFVFMDTESYDQTNISPAALGEAADYLIEIGRAHV